MKVNLFSFFLFFFLKKNLILSNLILNFKLASKKMIQKVRELKNEKYIGSLCVITGTGHHSYDYSKRVNPNEGKLSPAIRGLLKDLGFTPFDISPDKRGGMLLIQFQE